MQSCQGLIDFLDNKLASAPEKYAKSDVDNVRKGLEGYNQYIQSDIVTPGLLKFNGGDATKADAMQKRPLISEPVWPTAYESLTGQPAEIVIALSALCVGGAIVLLFERFAVRTPASAV